LNFATNFDRLLTTLIQESYAIERKARAMRQSLVGRKCAKALCVDCISADDSAVHLYPDFQWAPKDARFRQRSSLWLFKGHPKLFILIPIENAHATSY